MVDFKLDGNSEETINLVALACILGVCSAALVGYVLDRVCCRGPAAADGPRGCPFFVGLVMTASYVLLVPGLTSVLFSFNIILDFGFFKLGVGPGGGMNQAPPVTESMLGLVGLLRSTDCELGAAAVVLYAMAVPAVKVVLLLLGEGLRLHPLGAVCAHAVQSISKWACPDMFAYIFLLYLVRGLNHPMMLRSQMRLDMGFTCFSVFCVASTVASLGMHTAHGEGRFPIFSHVAKVLGNLGVLLVVVLVAVAFFAALTYGMFTSVMSLRIQMDDLYSPRGPIPSTIMGIEVQPIIDALHIPEKANADVSLWDAMRSLWESMLTGEVNSFIALVMLAFFVVALTVLDVLVLAAIAASLLVGQPALARPLVQAAMALRKLSMLDVMVMGVIVVTFCMSMYHKDGIWVTMRPGVVGLLIAELLHYLAYYLVMGAAHQPGAIPSGSSSNELLKLTQRDYFSPNASGLHENVYDDSDRVEHGDGGL